MNSNLIAGVTYTGRYQYNITLLFHSRVISRRGEAQFGMGDVHNQKLSRWHSFSQESSSVIFLKLLSFLLIEETVFAHSITRANLPGDWTA